MKKTTSNRDQLSEQESELIEQLRQRPEMMDRVQHILEIARNEGELKTADEVEQLLVEEMRKLGNTTMRDWAAGAQKRIIQELRDKEPGLRCRKKKTLKWWTVFGLVEVRESIWASDNCRYLRPLLKRLGVTPRGRSRRLQRVLTDFGCEHSFVRAAQSVREHYGFEVGATAVREATLFHAQRARAQLDKQYQEPFRALPPKGADYVIAEADGTMICTVETGAREGKRPRQWKEMRLVAAQARDSATTTYAATFGSVEETGRRWGHCTRQAGWGLNSQIHALGDGADWIRLQSREIFGRQGNFLCDFYHVSEYLGAASVRCRPQRPESWRRVQQKRLRRGAVQMVIEALKPHVESDSTSDEEAPVRNGHRYLSNRLDCLDYPRALALGLPIGSGMIESGHRHVLHARLKKAGAAWLSNHADQIAHLRVLRANRQWESLWN